MKHVVVDLEMNRMGRKSKVRSICKSETIEIGAVMLDDGLQEISSFRTFVKPEFSEGIASNISRLTGITDDLILTAPKFNDALHKFCHWCLESGDDVTVYAWSDNDYRMISKEMNLKGFDMSDAESGLLAHEWLDFQQEFDSRLGFDRKVSLSLALDMAGIAFSGREHDALDDARNTAALLQVFRDEELFNETLCKIKDAMTPKEFGYSIGDLFDLSGFACVK